MRPSLVRVERHPSRVPYAAMCMGADSALTRAIDEWSRRFLRSVTITLEAPKIHHERFIDLHNMKNEAIPSVYSTFNVIENNEACLDLRVDERLIGRIGYEPPSHDTVHVPTKDLNIVLDLIEASIQKLIQAGYPGCVGCGGKDALEPWDEFASRVRLSQ